MGAMPVDDPGTNMDKALRILGTSVLVLVALRILDLFLYPALPLLAAIFLTGYIIYFAITGRRGL
jgi:hypothetical protein